MRKINDGEHNDENIKFFADFPIYKKKKKHMGVLIITERSLLFLKDIKTVLFQTQLSDIQKSEVYVGGTDPESNLPVYHLYVFTRKSGDFPLESDHYSLVDKTYSILTKEKARWKRKKTKKLVITDGATSLSGFR